MPFTKRTWLFYVLISLVALGLWLRFGYPEFSFVDLSVSKKTAVAIAEQYLQDHQKIALQKYQHAVILNAEGSADRYLQKTLGLQGELKFLKENRLNLFSWLVRFFQEGKKEEFQVSINASTGEVVSFLHLIEDTAPRPDADLNTAYERTKRFLEKTFAVNFNHYTVKEKITKKYDQRTDFYFSWQKNDVAIPWSSHKDAGTAKLLIKARISGEELLFFDQNALDIPDGFNRMIEKSKQSGDILGSIFLVFYYLLIVAAVYFIVSRYYFLLIQKIKIFYLGLGSAAFLFMIFYYLNNIQSFLFDYPTTATLKIYFSQLGLHLLILSIFTSLAMVLPGLAGEALIQELAVTPKGFVRYLQTTFLSRHLFRSVILGYLIAVILLGLQAFLFYIGRKYFSVWTEHLQISQMSSSFWPFLTAFVISFRAAFSEEISFRLFGIHWGQKIFKNIIIACILTSLLWGFGHANYPVFPAWFRGFEVAVLGLLISFFYLRFGIVPVIVGHYLMDAFWGCAGFLLGRSQPFDFFSCLFIIAIPFLLGLISFAANKPDVEKPMFWKLSGRRLYNLKVLKSFISNAENTAGKTKDQMREELLSNGWDTAVIDEALKKQQLAKM